MKKLNTLVVILLTLMVWLFFQPIEIEESEYIILTQYAKFCPDKKLITESLVDEKVTYYEYKLIMECAKQEKIKNHVHKILEL